MVELYGRLNDRQLRVLRWVADGCPDGEMAYASYKRTAASLQDRRLLTIRRGRGGWRADLTDAGRFYLEHGHHPLGDPSAGSARRVVPKPAPRSPRPSPEDDQGVPAEGRPRGVSTEVPARAASPTRVDPRRPVEDITPEWVLEQVRHAGGELRLVDLDAADLAAWRRAAKVAQLRLLRVGRQRLHRWTGDGGLTLKLGLLPEPDADDDELTHTEIEQMLRVSTPPPVLPRPAELRGRRVPIPSKEASTDPRGEELIRALQRQDQRLYGVRYQFMARKKPIVRMRRLWQAIINEARYRGYEVYVRQEHRDPYDAGSLIVRIGRDDCKIKVYGDTVTPLSLRIETDPPQRRRRDDVWTDTDGVSVEQCLGDVFTRIEEHAEQQIEHRAAVERRAEQQQQARRAAEAEARREFAEDHRRRVIAQRINDTRYADDVRAYSRALRDRVERAPEDRREDVLAWAAWAEQYADSIDPRCTLAATPATPEPDRADLRPYLGAYAHYL